MTITTIKLPNRWITVLLIATYMLVFNLIYIYSATNLLEYPWVVYNQPNWFFFVVFCAIAITPSFIFTSNQRTPSQLLMWLLYLFVFIPSCFIPLYINATSNETLVLNTIFLLISLLIPVIALNSLPKKVTLPRIKASPELVAKILLIVSAISILAVVIKLNSYVGFVDFHHIYLKRAILAKALQIDQGGNIYGHFIMWNNKGILPLLLLYGMSTKKWLFSVYAIFGFLLLLAVIPFKDTVAIIAIIPIIYWFLKKTPPNKKVRAIIITLLLFLVISILSAIISGKPLLMRYLVDRLITGPGFLTGIYWKFFSNRPLTYLSDFPLFKAISYYPYTHSVAFEIGYFINHVYFNANANIWASAYAELGNLGMVCASLILTIYLWFFDVIAEKWNNAIPDTLMVLIAIDLLSNIPLQTALFSGGMLFYLILLWTLTPKEEKSWGKYCPQNLQPLN